MSEPQRSMPLARLFGGYVALNLATLGLCLGLLVAWGLDRAFERQLQRQLAARLEAVEKLLNRYVEVRVRILEDLAQSPQLVRAVTGKEPGLPPAVEFLSGVKVAGQTPRLLLFDQAGSLLHDTSGHAQCLPEERELRPLLGGEVQRGISFRLGCVNGEGQLEAACLRLAVPVTWQGSPAGVLVAELPVSDIDLLYEINRSSSLETLTLLKDGSVLFFPERTVEGLAKERSLPELGVEVRYVMDLSGAKEEQNTMLFRLALAVLVLMALFGSVTFLVGRRFFLAPLSALQRRAGLVRRGLQPSVMAKDFPVREFSELDAQLQESARVVLDKQRELEREIRHREEVAQALRESEERFRRIAENARDMLFRIALPEGRYEYVSPAALNLFGLPPQTFYEQPEAVTALLHPDYREPLDREWDAILAGRCAPVIEYRILTPAGEERWLHQRNVLIRDPAGAPQALEGIVTDLTDWKRAEQSLRASEEFNKRIIESSPDCIKVLDPDGRLTYMSSGGQQLMGIEDLSQVLGQDYPEFWLPEDRPLVREALEQARGGRTTSFQAYLPDMRGTPRWWSVSVTPLASEGDRPPRFLVVSRDITGLKNAEEEQRRAKEQALAASHAKSEFLANMSHEIRTPMNGVLGMAQLLAETPLQPEQREYLAVIETSARALLTLINDILDLSKIEADKLELQPEPFGLNGLIQDVINTLGSLAADKGISLTWEMQGQVPDILVGDARRLRQVCLNLVGNAIKFTEQGRVSVSVGCHGSCVLPEPGADEPLQQELVFTVEDTGIGIPAEHLGHIFESFAQADGSTSRRYGGTGLGLSIARRLVQLMGGELQVTSTPGQGSTFSFNAVFQVDPTLSLPEGSRSPRAGGALGRKLRILVVDDNEINRVVASRMLGKSGHEVRTAEDGLQALELLRREVFDLVFMDVQMPGLDGLEVTRRIRRARDLAGSPRVHVTAMTAHAMKGDRERYLAAGMDDYLPKPLSLEDVQEALQRFVLGKGAGRAPSPAVQGSVHDSAGASGEMPLLNRKSALERFAGDEELYKDVCRDFLESAPAKLQALEEAHAVGNQEALILQAHSLKGNAATLGAQRCAALAEALELAARQGNQQQVAVLIPGLRSCLDELDQALRALVDDPSTIA